MLLRPCIPASAGCDRRWSEELSGQFRALDPSLQPGEKEARGRPCSPQLPDRRVQLGGWSGALSFLGCASQSPFHVNDQEQLCGRLLEQEFQQHLLILKMFSVVPCFLVVNHSR